MSAEPRGVTRRKGGHVHMGKCGSNRIRTRGVPSGGTRTDDSGTADDERKGPGIEQNAAGRGSDVERSMYREYGRKMSGSLYTGPAARKVDRRRPVSKGQLVFRGRIQRHISSGSSALSDANNDAKEQR